MTKAVTAVYALTQQGAMTAARLAGRMAIELYVPPALMGNACLIKGAKPFGSLRALIAKTFTEYRRHVFITAAGVAVRCIAPSLESKTVDPAVVVLDQYGKHVISLLSGHLGGANALAKEVAEILGGQAVITTATDTENVPSLDVLAIEFNLSIGNIKAVAKVNSSLLAGRPVVVDDPSNHLRLKQSVWKDLFIFKETPAYAGISEAELAGMAKVTVTARLPRLEDNNLVLHPKVLHVGVGCRRGVNGREIVEFILETIRQLELSPLAIGCLASADVKQYEPGLRDAGEALDVPLQFFTARELDTVPVTSVSPKAREVFGIDGVCEPAAMLAAGENAVLRLPKHAGRGITIAVAEGTPHD